MTTIEALCQKAQSKKQITTEEYIWAKQMAPHTPGTIERHMLLSLCKQVENGEVFLA